jgi:hypothetical protein
MIVDGRTFKSQKELKTETARIINDIGRSCISIKTEHPIYFKFLTELLKRHPDPEKCCGVLDMCTIGIEAWRFPTVTLIKEGGEEDVSLLKKCVSGREPTDHAAQMIEYRKLIRPQIIAFRATAKQVCMFCNATTNLHVDHVIPFSKIAAEFTNGSFEAHHLDRATFQMLCSVCNMKKGATEP